MAREHRFEMIEHTADIGVIGYGDDMAGAFESVAYGMFSIMAELAKYEPTEYRTVTAVGDDEVELLERFLSTLLVMFDAERLLPLDFEITEISPRQLTCRVLVRKIGDDIEWLGPQVKAVTYHQMAVEQKNGQWMAKAIFDV